MKKREVWLDALRIVSAFLVIVNHTNSDVFQSLTPASGAWWLSILWYALCKVAVPVFVMISGACLLGRQDSYRRALARLGRTVGALLAFSYLYFLHDAWLYYGLWPRALRLDVFFHLVWTQQIADSFWYLYFYAGLMLALPLLQRLSCAMRDRDAWYLVGICLGLGSAWPLLSAFAPGLALPESFIVPQAAALLGLFFAGWQLRKRSRPLYVMPPLLCLGGSVFVSALLLHHSYVLTPEGGKYWAFLDDRLNPSLLTVAAAVSLFQLLRCLMDRPHSPRAQRVWSELGACAFGVYLWQEWVIAQTEFRLFEPLRDQLPVLVALVIWEAAVFVLALAAAWIARRTPLLRRLV